MAAPQITLYVDIISPFAYIAFHVLKNSPTFAKCNVTYVPILLGGLMQATGNNPPINIKNKDKWINLERIRWAKYFSVPVADRAPDGFPQRTLAVQRALCAVAENVPSQMPSVLEALYRSFWVDRNAKIGEPEGFIPVLEKVLGKNTTQDIVSAIARPEIKTQLTANTDRAFKSGAFGLPWFECTDAKGNTEGFWGIDHLGQVVDFLGLDRSRDAGFRAVL
ncbi:thioredoxin-like protein [Penicillium capsulatum]|nr:thioredoxin-like protein [Penicillium capsulatum]